MGRRHIDGNIIDPDEPSTGNILELMNDPVLTHKGNWTAWLGALIISIFNAFSILYADEIFRWNLAFQIRDTDGAEFTRDELRGLGVQSFSKDENGYTIVTYTDGSTQNIGQKESLKSNN